MSSTLSGLSPVTSYLSIIKNEQADIAAMVKSTPAEQRTVAAFQNDIVNISTPSDLLASGNQSALQVVLGAYNMSGESTETGLLKKLLTQDPSVTGSLVQSLADTDDLHFVQAMTSRATVSFNFGDPSAEGFVTGGSAASSVSMQNLVWGTADPDLTAASPARSWAYVLDNGTASASIAAALTTAVQSTGTTAAPVTTSYSVNSSGAIVGSAGAPAVVSSKDSVGNTVYSLTLATDTTGAAVRLASVVAVTAPVTTNTVTTLSNTISTAIATPLLTSALTASGFNIQTGAAGSFDILNPITNGPLSLSQQSYSSFVGVTSQAITTKQTVLPLGTAGEGLQAGQILTSGGAAIGTIGSVDALGNVTLTALSAIAVAAGAQIEVAIGAGVSDVGIQLTSTNAVAAGATTLALGKAAIALQTGQIITDGSNVIGIVKSVDKTGTVTLQAGAAASVAAGDTLGIVPKITDTQTAALLDSSNAAAVLTSYETSQFETAEGKQITGLDSALYFTRTMPAITTINELMSNTTLLDVVTTNLGVSSTFGSLPYDQQVSLLTSKVNLKNFSTTTGVQNYAEQYLAMSAEPATGISADEAALNLLTGGASSTSSTSATFLSILYPGSNSSSDPGSILSLFDNESSSTTSIVSLFT